MSLPEIVSGDEWRAARGKRGHSVFPHVGDEPFHTYSMYARGAEWLGGSYAFLDLTPLGRQEDWEEPKGRAEAGRPAVPNFAS